MPSVLKRLLDEQAPADTSSDLMAVETAMADLDPEAMHDPDRPGTPSGYACPDCHGALFEIEEGPLVRYRCRVGHAWSPESLVARQTADLESALWMAMRSLEEKASLNKQQIVRALDRGHDLTARKLESDAAEAVQAAELLRDLIERVGRGASPTPGE
jgi:two-component system, chemotaxis family, protein-glutamate methylesterase/glutaminase